VTSPDVITPNRDAMLKPIRWRLVRAPEERRELLERRRTLQPIAVRVSRAEMD